MQDESSTTKGGFLHRILYAMVPPVMLVSAVLRIDFWGPAPPPLGLSRRESVQVTLEELRPCMDLASLSVLQLLPCRACAAPTGRVAVHACLMAVLVVVPSWPSASGVGYV